MAASVSTRILEDGPRNAIILVQGDNGGTGVAASGADLAYQQLILPAALGYLDLRSKSRAAQLRVDVLEWDIQAESSLQVELFWDATTPQQLYDMIGRASRHFGSFGGLSAPANLAGNTGGIGIKTVGASTQFDNGYTFVLKLVKQ